MPETPSHQINLLDFLAFLLRWRKFLITVVLSAVAIAVVISFLTNPVYRSTAVIHATEQNSQGFSQFIAARLSALSGITGMGQMFGDTPAEMYIQILRSRWLNERLIEKFDLRKVYRMPDVPIEQVLQAVKAHTRFEIDPLSTATTIYSEDNDPKRCQAMTQFLVDELDKRNQELRSTSARREREFISQRLDDAKATLLSLEDSMAAFQVSSGIMNVTEQVKATMEAAAQLEAQRLETQTQLEMNRQVFGPGNPEGTVLRLRLTSLDSTLNAFTGSHQAKGSSGDVLLHLKDAPREAITYYRLTRDIEVQELLVSFLIQQFEQAKLEEQRDTPTIMRIDPPVVATQRVWPKRSLMAGAAGFGALVFSILFAAIYDRFREASSNPEHPQHQKLVAIQQAWSKPSKRNQV